MRKFFGPSRTHDWTDYWSNNSSFVKTCISSWKKWASQNNALVEVLEHLPSPSECGFSKDQLDIFLNLAPPLQRWVLPSYIYQQHGNDTRIATIDADTLISPKTPSIFQQSQTDVVLTGNGYEWTSWKNKACEAFAPLFPQIKFDKNLYFNAGVMILNNNILPNAFSNFVLNHSNDILSIINGKVGVDEVLVNFMVQQLIKDHKLTFSYLGKKWNARMDLELKEVNSTSDNQITAAQKIASENYISHFIRTKDLMPAAWQSLESSSQ